MKTGSQKVQGSQQVGPNFSLGAQGFSGVPAMPTLHLTITGAKDTPSTGQGWDPSKSTWGLEIKGRPPPRPCQSHMTQGFTHVLHVAGRDGLPVAVDGALSNDDNVQAGPSAPSLGQRHCRAQPPACRHLSPDTWSPPWGPRLRAHVGEPGPCCPTWAWGSGRKSLWRAGGLQNSCPPPTPQAEGSLTASAGKDELAPLIVANERVLGDLKVLFTYFLNKHL